MCSFVLPFRNADRIFDSADFTFSSTVKWRPVAQISLSKIGNYAFRSKDGSGAVREKSRSSEKRSSP